MDEKERLQGGIDYEYDYARKVLKHYFHLLRKKVGHPYDSDYDAELDGAIDSIQKAVEYQIKLAMLDRRG